MDQSVHLFLLVKQAAPFLINGDLHHFFDVNHSLYYQSLLVAVVIRTGTIVSLLVTILYAMFPVLKITLNDLRHDTLTFFKVIFDVSSPFVRECRTSLLSSVSPNTTTFSC